MTARPTNPPPAAEGQLKLPRAIHPDKLRLHAQLSQLHPSWQSPPLAVLQPQPFSAVMWIAANLDLSHPPLPERDMPILAALSIIELKLVYHTLSTHCTTPDWPDFGWSIFTDTLERELALER